MQLLAPWFLAGLAAIAVPVLIHLINRERKTVVEFPSLMFLQRIPYKSVRRQRLRHLLLLALRCLALALLVAAFSRPFWSGRAGAVLGGAGARERVILLDRSYSMAYGDHWARASAAARAATEDLASSDRATLILFDNEATVATEPTGDRARLTAAIASAKAGDQATRYGPALKLAAQILEGSNLPRREVRLISDFQRAGWSASGDVHLPPRTTMQTVDVSQELSPDLAITSVAADRTGRGDRDQVTVTARVTSNASAPRDVPVTLALAGRDLQTVRVAVPARGAAQARFSAAPVPAGAVRGEVRLPHDAQPRNDSWRFAVAADEAVKVLVVEPTRARGNQSLFVKQALSIGDQPRFSVDVRRTDELAPADLTGRSLVVLNEVPFPSGAIGARLRALVEAGTGLLVAPGDLRTVAWPATWTALAAITLGEVSDRTRDAGGAIASVDYSHPALELFSAPRSGDLGSARVFRARRATVRGDSGVLARLDDGLPLLVERRVGQGSVLLWNTSLDDYWTDLPVQPVWLPLAHQLAVHAGRWSERRPWFTAGGSLDLSRHGELMAMFQRGDGSVPTLVLESPDGKRRRITSDSVARPITLEVAGFYELRGAETAVGSGRPIAVNVDPAESDMTHVDPAEMTASVTATPPSGLGAAAVNGEESPAERERRQGLWPFVLVALLLLLGAETVLGNRLTMQA